MKKLLLLLLLVTINVTAQGNPDKFRDGIKTPFTQYNELTTTQKLALPQVKGTVVYDTDLDKLQVFDGVNWVGYFNAALDTTDDIIEGNNNKFITVFEREKLDDITFDGNTNNTFLGIGAGDISTGNSITATGIRAAINTTGSDITATGRSAAANSTGSNIIATGLSAAADTNGDQIVALGLEAARYSSGSNTVAVGNISGRNAIGNSITSIGYGAGTFPFSNTLQTPNSTAIGANTIIDKANQAAIGDSAVTELKIGETLVVDKAQIVAQPEGVLVTKKINGKTVVEVSNDLETQINSIQFEEVKTYQSLSALPDPLNLPDGLAAKVSNDTTETNNGYYSVVSGVWVKDSDLHENIVEETNTTRGVTGKAVFDETQKTLKEAGLLWQNCFSDWNTSKIVPLSKLKIKGLDSETKYYLKQLGYKVATSSAPNGVLFVINSIDDSETYLLRDFTGTRQGLFSVGNVTIEYELSSLVQDNTTYLYTNIENEISKQNLIENDIYFVNESETVPAEVFSLWNTSKVNFIESLKIFGLPKGEDYYLLIASYKKVGSSLPNGSFFAINDTNGNSYLFRNPEGEKEGVYRDLNNRFIAKVKFKDDVVDNTNVEYSVSENRISTKVFEYDDIWANITNSKWAGKHIYWCGTSIPTGNSSIADDGEVQKYPERAAKELMARISNRGIGASMCRANVLTGDYVDLDLDNLVRAMSRTEEEMAFLRDNWNSYKGVLRGDWSSFTEMPAVQQSLTLVSSFEYLLKPYLDGSIEMPDLFVIDHGHNDFKYTKPDGSTDIEVLPTVANISIGLLAEDVYMTANNNEKLESFFGSLSDIEPSRKADFIASVNRNCYIGAINFIVTYILVNNPRARFAFISNYENHTAKAPLIDAQKYIADSWQSPLAEMYKYLGFANKIIPGTKNFWGDNRTYDLERWDVYLQDGVHPFTDGTGETTANYTNVLVNFLKGI